MFVRRAISHGEQGVTILGSSFSLPPRLHPREQAHLAIGSDLRLGASMTLSFGDTPSFARVIVSVKGDVPQGKQYIAMFQNRIERPRNRLEREKSGGPPARFSLRGWYI